MIPAVDKTSAGIFMVTRVIPSIVSVLVCVVTSAQTSSQHDQTPVQQVIFKYAGTQGARNYIAEGIKLTLARKIMRTTPLAPIASDVDELAILKMEDVPRNIRAHFVRDLDDALEHYKSYGTHPSKNGDVDIYLLPAASDRVVELVIYNPEIYSLNSVHGNFTLSQLLRLDK